MSILWDEYPTIATHPEHPDAVRLVRHPNGPAIVHGPQLQTIGFFIYSVASSLGPREAGEYAQWIAFALDPQNEKPCQFSVVLSELRAKSDSAALESLTIDGDGKMRP